MKRFSVARLTAKACFAIFIVVTFPVVVVGALYATVAGSFLAGMDFAGAAADWLSENT